MMVALAIVGGVTVGVVALGGLYLVAMLLYARHIGEEWIA